MGLIVLVLDHCLCFTLVRCPSSLADIVVHTFKHDYLLNLLINLDQILFVALLSLNNILFQK